MKREQIKALIQLSETVEDADEVIQKEGFETVREKMAFLRGMFDFKLIGRSDIDGVDVNASLTMDYFAILSAIINEKWEA